VISIPFHILCNSWNSFFSTQFACYQISPRLALTHSISCLQSSVENRFQQSLLFCEWRHTLISCGVQNTWRRIESWWSSQCLQRSSDWLRFESAQFA
jgi:hypothetical protein